MKRPVRPKHPQRVEQRRTGASLVERTTTPGTINDESIAASTAQIYDDGLIDRCRDQWRRGEWEALGQLSIDDIERNPNRARLALLAAAAHQANGNAAQTRLFVRLASQWGCDPRLVARTLLAGVHNTLGRAAAAGGKHRDRALYHFNEAVAPGTASASRWLIAQERVRQQLEQLQLGTEATAMLTGVRSQALPSRSIVATPFRELGDALHKNGALLLAGLKEQTEQLTKLRKGLDGTVKKEVGNAIKQLEAFINLQRYFGEGQLVPELHGWPISPDFGQLLVSLIEQNDYDLIIEMGSGTSTVLMANVLSRTTARRLKIGKCRPVQVALEHEESFHAKTDRLLAAAELRERVQLVLAPLKPYTAPGGNVFQYYDCGAVLSALSKTMGPPSLLRLLLMVDGPPGSTGPHARYPALPLVLEYFKGARMDVLLDDYVRDEEKQIAQLWIEDLTSSGFNPTLTAMRLEKDACLICF